jgi:predicted membrane protein
MRIGVSMSHNRHHRPYVGGIILIIIGVLFLLDNFGYASFGELIHDYWPVILIIIGLSLLMRKSDTFMDSSTSSCGCESGGPSSKQEETQNSSHGFSSSSSEKVSANNTFGDVNMVLTSKSFQGGNINTVFGEVDVDASSIELAPGEQVLQVHTVFGRTRISLPKGIAVRITADTSFGKLRVMEIYKNGIFQDIDYSTDGYDMAEKKLRLIVGQVFGDLRIS